MIQQSIPLQLQLNGDGTSTSFTFDLGKVYGLHFSPTPSNPGGPAPFVPLNIDAIPDGVSIAYSSPSIGPITASIAKRAITLSFSPFSGSTIIGMDLLFNG